MNSGHSAFASPGDSPGLPPGQAERYQGPWFSTQLTLSLAIGLSSFLFFCFARRVEKWKVLYSPRTLLKGFSPHEVHDRQTYFGWILPTLRTSEFTVLQIVGLDAAVLLSFFRTCFLFFLACTVLAGTVLVPINYRETGTSEGALPDPGPGGGGHHSNKTDVESLFLQMSAHATVNYYKPRTGSTMFLTSHCVFTYAFTIMALALLQRNYARYIPLRQLFSLELSHSIPGRTVVVTRLPLHLRSEKALAEYFEGIRLGSTGDASGLGVESVTLTRAVGGMHELLDKRTNALRILESAWCKYLGNPVPSDGPKAVFGYDSAIEVERIMDPEAKQDDSVVTHDQEPNYGATGRLIDVEEGGRGRTSDDIDQHERDIEAHLLSPSRPTIVNPSRPRPTIRARWFGKKVDALDYYAEQFRQADEDVRRRRKGKFRPTGVAFVTFESLAAAQIAAQTVHYPSATVFRTELAPEPRDIHWSNLSLAPSSVFVRQLLVVLTVLVLLSVWSIPVLFLSKLLSWDSIEDAAPRLAKFIGKIPRLRAFVQTSLPSLGMVAFNNFTPFFYEAISIFQGLPARSFIELALLKKYHLSLLFTTLFAFITLSTYSLLQDISESPAKVLDKLANTLPGARNFFVSYVMLSGVALMPLQLLELAVIIPRLFYRVFYTRTPRDHAELNAPPMLNLGSVYPQALLIFTIGITYSIISPLILPFTALYFGLAYLVYKYKLLFVYYRPYESRGQAWPLAANRIAWGLLIFQVFMLGLFITRKAFLLAGLIIPLVIGTAYSSYKMHKVYEPLSRFVNLSQACEVSVGGGASDIMKLRRGHPVTRSQTNLNRGRYGHDGEGLYVVGKNSATDYAQPPLSLSYPGVLNTGRRRYGHPALSGALPEPWLPIMQEAQDVEGVSPIVKEALVLDLRRRWSRVKRAARSTVNTVPGVNVPDGETEENGTNGDDGEGQGEGDGNLQRGMSGSKMKRSRRHSCRSLDEHLDDPSQAWRANTEGVLAPIEVDYGRDGHGDSTGDLFSDTEDEDMEEDGDGDGGMTRYRTYWHRRDRNEFADRATFPPQNTESQHADE